MSFESNVLRIEDFRKSLVEKKLVDVIQPETDPKTLIDLLCSTTTEDIWELELKLISDLVSNEELKHFFQNKPWNYSEDVLEIGLGSEAVIGSKKMYFSDKRHWQVYLWPKVTSGYRGAKVAEMEELGDHIQSYKKGMYDTIVLRRLGDFAKDPKEYIQNIKRYLKPDGQILLVEEDATLKLFAPEIPMLDELMGRWLLMERNQRPYDSSHDFVLEEAKNLNLKVNFNDTLPVLVSHEDELRTLFTASVLKGETIFRKVGGRMDQNRYFEQLKLWFKNPGCHAQVGVRLISLSHM